MNDEEEMGEPEDFDDPRKQPPFEPLNEVALKHGAYSPRRVEPLADGLVAGVLVEAALPGSSSAYLREPSFRPALWAWARAEARCQLLTEWLIDNGGDLTAGGDVKGAAEHLRRWEAQALKHREQLGLAPLARARMGRDVAAGSVDMAKLMAELDDAEDHGSQLEVEEEAHDDGE